MTHCAQIVGRRSAMSVRRWRVYLVSTGRAHADPVWHHVVYIVTAENPIYIDIYYQDHEPTLFSDYSHNTYSFTPQVDADLAPGKPWVQPVESVEPR